ncbi:divalent-cation tolerance protein CutA [Brevibacterium jeotgali]|uniref:Divalent cation tolerance protein n=1 Tax=Brevibacterium jeotgali TaxID=1262550 RepID=A0A2H1L8D3_9MICO|nr:divalent-cation tolerance protein CutA [Brevibacterium jeotgali]TWC02305.1 periplasmic divalent cation tolerance protein [Brevibacterium jeotgali]SMY12643.1 divalent cation tolerance protein [Brevibacterium jeotgali]
MTGTPHQPDMQPGAVPGSQPACVAAETTTDSREVAEHLASTAVDQCLAACVQISAIRSYYRWEGEVQNDPEFLLTFKTTAAAADGPLKEFLDREHPYDEPELIIVPIIGGSDSYLAWIADSVTVD